MHGRLTTLGLGWRLAVLVAFLFFFLFPFYWIIATSLKTQVDAFAIPPKWLFDPTVANYLKVLLDTEFLRQTVNSLIASTANAVVTLALALPRRVQHVAVRDGGKGPPLLVPQHPHDPADRGRHPALRPRREVPADRHLRHPPPVLYIILNMPFAVWMLKSFIDEIPREIDESAMLDGCGNLAVIWRMILPLIKPGPGRDRGLLLHPRLERVPARQHLHPPGRGDPSPVGISKFITEKQILWGYITAAANPRPPFRRWCCYGSFSGTSCAASPSGRYADETTGASE